MSEFHFGRDQMEKKYYIHEIGDLKPGDHLCCLYETDEEHKALLTPYMRLGLENNEKVLYIVDSNTSETVLDYLREDGVDVDPYLKRGQLTILTVNESYMKGGVFDPDEMIKMLGEEVEKALKEGYDALRVTGEMSWALQELPGSQRLIEYEAKLNEFFPNNKVIAICQYDMRLFNPEMLLKILITHPIVVIGTKIYENFYFIPPEKYPFDNHDLTLKEWIKSLEKYNTANKFRENLFNSMMDGLAVVDADGVHLDVNDAFCEMTGYSRDELIGNRPPFLYWPEEEYNNIENAFEKTLKGNLEEFEFVFKRKNGQRFPVILSPSVMKDDNDKVIAAFATIKDISRRKTTENELKEAHSKLEATLKAIPDLMFELDREGRIYDYYAPESDKLYTSPDVFMGKRISEVLPEDAAAKIQQAIDKAAKQGWHKGTIYSLDLPTGRKWFEISIAKKTVIRGPELFVSVVRDITPRQKNEIALKQALNYNRSLIEANIDPLVTIGADGKVTDVNAAVELVTGYKRDEVIGTDFSDYFTDPQKAKEGYEKVFREGFVRDYPLEIQHKDGHVTPVIYNASVYKDDDGKVLGVFAAARDITELKRIENDLRKSYIYNRSLIEASLDPLVTIGFDGKVTDVNAAVEMVTGYSRDEVIGTDFSDYFTDPEMAEAGYRQVFEEGWVRDYPLEIQHKDGHVTPVIYNASVYKDENGEVIGVFATARDINKLKKAEKALNDSQSRLNAIMEGTPIPKFVIDKDHRVIYWNKALEELSQIKAEDVVDTQDQWRAFYDKKRPCMVDLVVDGALNKLNQWYDGRFHKSKFLKGAYEVTDFFPAMGNNGRWLFFTAAPIKDSEGNLIGAVETLEDITQRKKGEFALQKSEERFRAVAESAVDAIVTTDVNGVIKFFNDSLMTIFGYSKEELTGQPLTTLMPQRLKSAYLNELKRFKNSGEHRLIGKTVATTGLRKDGTEFPFEMSLSSWESGDKTFFTSMIRDLTDKKKAEEAVKKQVTLTTSINQVLQDSLRAEKDEEVALICLRVAEKLTNSKFGFVMEINNRGTSDTMAVSDPGWAECQIPQKEAIKLLSGMEISSYWGRVLKQGKSQIVNHPEYDPDSRGVPEGHPIISSFLGVPLKRGDVTIGLIGLANKEDG